MLKIELDRKQIRLFTLKCLMLEVLQFPKKNPAKGSFILSDLLGNHWAEEFKPFWELYGTEKVRGQEMGKLLSKVAKELSLRNIKENRFGKKDAITRYFF